MLRRTLAAEPGLDVVGVAKDGESAVEMAAKLDPDAVIMVIELPGEMDGIDAAVHRNSHPVHAQRPPLRLQPTSERNPRLGLPAQTERPRDGLGVAAIQGSVDGMVVLDPEVVESLQPKQGSPAVRLTPRQRRVLELIAQGFNNTTIAQRLTLTEKSVETYINAIYQVLQIPGEEGMHSRVKATLVYLQDS